MQNHEESLFCTSEGLSILNFIGRESCWSWYLAATGNYAQLLFRTVTYEYKIFGVSSPLNVDVVDMKLLIIGSLTGDEESTLSQLLNMGLKPNVSQTQKKASASAASEGDLDRVKRELAIPTPPTSRRAPHNSKAIKVTVESLVKVRRISKEDILLAKQRVKVECSKSMSTIKAGKRSNKIRQVKRSVILKKKGHFDVVVHKLQKRKCKYHYRCKVKECSASFSKTSAWNVHYLVKHKDVKFRWNECRKVLQTPLSLRTIKTCIKSVTLNVTIVIINLSFVVNWEPTVACIEGKNYTVALLWIVTEVTNGGMIY